MSILSCVAASSNSGFFALTLRMFHWRMRIAESVGSVGRLVLVGVDLCG